jgi:bla regulator protein blaR1
MKIFQTINFADLTTALGWTLVHSLWQSLLIAFLTFSILRLLPKTSSQLRYIVGCSAIFLVVLSAFVTFLVVVEKNIGSGTSWTAMQFVQGTAQGIYLSVDVGLLDKVLALLNANMSWIMIAWSVGAALFSFRLLTGWWYLDRLIKRSVVCENSWATRLDELAESLQIRTKIVLAESAAIATPMVVGYLKPVILIPVGMFSGLSTEQIESIFLHELAHIRRHDYIVNVIQSIVEVIFFFNPFVWILSGFVRKEREFCCDDAVVNHNISAMAYAKALAHLEEVRISANIFGLTLAANKHQLLNRIQRIMERSLNTSTGREKFIPALLLVIGLLCASWLTIEKDPDSRTREIAASDTVIKKKNDSKFYRKSENSRDGDGTVYEDVTEEITEEFEGHQELEPVFAIPDFDFETSVEAFPPMEAITPSLAFPVIPDFPDHVVEVPFIDAMPFISAIDAVKPFDIYYPDTVPGRVYRKRDWEEFNAEFEEKFRERFEKFYKDHEKDLAKMMEELQEKFDDKELSKLADLERIAAKMDRLDGLDELQRALRESEQVLNKISERSEDRMHERDENFEKRSREMEERSKQMERRSPDMKERSEDMEFWSREMEEDMKKLEVELKAFEENMKAFEKELKEELVKDGYISKNTNIDNIKIDDDGEIEVNGIEIKEKHREKYRALQKKYFKDAPRSRNRVE